MIKRVILIGIILIVVLMSVQFFYSGYPDDVAPKDSFDVIAHRDVHTNWEKGTYDQLTGCEATHIVVGLCYSPGGFSPSVDNAELLRYSRSGAIGRAIHFNNSLIIITNSKRVR